MTNKRTVVQEGPLNQIKMSYLIFKGLWNKLKNKDTSKAEQDIEPDVQQTINRFVQQEGDKDIPQDALDKVKKIAPPGQEKEYEVAAPAIALALEWLTGTMVSLDEKDALEIIKLVMGKKQFDLKDQDTKKLLGDIITPIMVVIKMASGNVPGALATASKGKVAGQLAGQMESKQPLQEGFFQDLLVKLRVVDSKKLVNSLFDIAEKKLKGLDKRARMREDGKTKVVDIGSAISFLGGKGVDLNFTEANKSVEAFAKATKDLNIKHKALMTVLSKGTDKYMPIEDVKKMLTLVMVMAQLADLVNEVSTRIGYTVPEAPKAEKPAAEEKPQGTPAKAPEVAKQAAAKVPDLEAPAKVDPRIQKAVEGVKAKAEDKAAERKEEPTPPPKQASKQKQDQYDQVKDIIDLAITTICEITSLSEEEAKSVVDAVIINDKVDLRKTNVLFLTLTTLALEAIGTENIKDASVRSAIKKGLAMAVGAEGGEEEAPNKAIGESLDYGAIDALLMEQMHRDGLDK